jgi:hypothetical protein
MIATEELEGMRDALQRARYAGVRTVEYDGHSITYASDAEMRRALAALERQIAERSSQKPVSVVRIKHAGADS